MRIFDLRKNIQSGFENALSGEEFLLILKKLELAKNIYARYDLETEKALSLSPEERLSARELAALGAHLVFCVAQKQDIAGFSTLSNSRKKFFPSLNFRKEFNVCMESFLTA